MKGINKNCIAEITSLQLFVLVVAIFSIGMLIWASSIYIEKSNNYESSVDVSYIHYIQETNGKNTTITEKYQTITTVCGLYSTFPDRCIDDLSKRAGLK